MGPKKHSIPLCLLICLAFSSVQAADSTNYTTNIQDIDLLLELGYYVNIVDQTPIKLQADPTSGNPFRDFSGCHVTPISCNFQLELLANVIPNPVLGGQWTATVTPKLIPIGESDIEICVSAKNVEVKNLPPGGQGVKVAEVKLSVIPLNL